MIGDNGSEMPSSDGAFEQASRNTLALNPLIGVRGKDLLDGAAVLVRAMINEPKVAVDEWGAFLRELTDIARGKSERTPVAGDKRFADPVWKSSPLHGGLLKAYLAWGSALDALSAKAA
jgi:polyhydroxyalkanoate synthase